MNKVMRQGFQAELAKLCAKDEKKKQPLAGKVVDTVAKGVAGAGVAAGVIGGGALGVGHVLRSEGRHGELLKALGEIRDSVKNKNLVTDAPGVAKAVTGHVGDALKWLKSVKFGSASQSAFLGELEKLAISDKAKTSLKWLGASAALAAGIALPHVVGRMVGDKAVTSRVIKADAANIYSYANDLPISHSKVKTAMVGSAGSAKLAVSPGKAVEAIFHRVYGKTQVVPTIQRMAKGYMETAERMGSPVTREGAKAWIQQVQKTKAL